MGGKSKKIIIICRWGKPLQRQTYNCYLLAALGILLGQAVLVHDPAGPDALRSLAGVENEGLLQANRAEVLCPYHPIGSRCLPIAGSGDAVRPIAVPILAVSRDIEEPFLFTDCCQGCSWGRDECMPTI